MEMERPKRSGFRKIDNGLFQAIMHAHLTGAGYQVLLTVIDRTLGFQKEEATIPLTYFQNVTGLSRQSVRSAIKQAEERCIIQAQREGTKPTVYSINDCREWIARKRSHPSKLGNEITPSWETKSPQARKLAKPRTRYPKETLKENIKEKGTYKERVLTNITAYGQASSSQTALSSNRVETIPGEGSTAEGNLVKPNPNKTYQEQIIAYLNNNGPSAIEVIAKDTGIDANWVDIALCRDKDEVFYNDSQKGIWGLIGENDE